MTAAGLQVSRQSVRYIIRKKEGTKLMNLDAVIENYQNAWEFVLSQEYEPKQNTLPEFLLIVNEQIKEQYRSFGRTFSFDFTFSVIQDRWKKEGEQR